MSRSGRRLEPTARSGVASCIPSCRATACLTYLFLLVVAIKPLLQIETLCSSNHINTDLHDLAEYG